MYLAEIHGKLSSRIETMEDILTSNIFSFFKYSSREIFLKKFLNQLGFDISEQEAETAEFIFWPRFEENTEPDLVIIAGQYYFLFESKYFSDFGKETNTTKAQLIREIEGGLIESANFRKKFHLIIITADYYYKKDKFTIIPSEFKPNFTWTNWQSIALLLANILESDVEIKSHERAFATDLYNLLDKKKLRDFHGFDNLFNIVKSLKLLLNIFFDAKTAKYRGAFIGFENALAHEGKLLPAEKTIFLEKQKTIFSILSNSREITQSDSNIFFERS